MKKRAKRRLLTQKVVNERLKLVRELVGKHNCQFIKTLLAEPHRLAKKVDCGEIGCSEKLCPFYSELKQERNKHKSYRRIDMKRREL